ncbi:MAG TPA: hypothetical protein VMW83_07965 [Spirochaetia bacterium]|nr:hypothetical protein [Spirochaetia bacterium]
MERYRLGVLVAVVLVLLGLGVYMGRGMVGTGTPTPPAKNKTAAARRFIAGLVLDVTGNSLVVHQNKGATIFTVATGPDTKILKKGGQKAVLADIKPGLTVAAQGDFTAGYLKATLVRIQGGQAWNTGYLPNPPG